MPMSRNAAADARGLRRPSVHRLAPRALALAAAIAAGAAVAPAAWAQAASPAAPAASAASAEPLAATFFRRARFLSPRLSPDAKFVAAIIPSAVTHREALAVVDLADQSKSKIVALFDDADIGAVAWVNDDRLVFWIEDRQETAVGQSTGMWSVDRDGKEPPRLLIAGRYTSREEAGIIKSHVLQGAYGFAGTLRDGSNDVLVEQYHYTAKGDIGSVSLLRLDTTNGQTRDLGGDAPPETKGWGVSSDGVPRVAVTESAGRRTVYMRTGPGAPWRKVLEGDDLTSDFGPLGFDVKDGIAYVSLRREGTDVSTLASMPLSGTLADAHTIVGLKGYDFDGRLYSDASGRLAGVQYETDARGTVWFNADMKKMQARIDALLPSTINLIDCERCGQQDVVLVTSYSDRKPAVFNLYDRRKDALQPVADALPWVDPRKMAPVEETAFTARDGMSIPVQVTRPLGAKGPLPAVVMVHGGPYVRGNDWAWNPVSQYLAARGYVVIEPEYRGSTGYGFQHFHAGWKQWGLKMQDDIADATTWAEKKGYADPQRVAIAGASYGGYATLMGLVRYPQLYRCGVEWAGVTDIRFLYEFGWSDASPYYLTYGMPRMVGDLKADAKQLEETSPVSQAAKITQPLLMAYGTEDVRVPFQHGTEMRDALRKTNDHVEWVAYPGEGHGWTLEANNIDWFTRMGDFLDKYLKAPAASPAR